MIEENSFRFGMARVFNSNYWVYDVVILPDKTIKRRGLRNWLLNHHKIEKDEIDSLIEAGATTIVVGTGCYSKASVSRTVMEYTAGKGLELLVLSSKEAVKELDKYDTHRDNVGAIIHLLC